MRRTAPTGWGALLLVAYLYTPAVSQDPVPGQAVVGTGPIAAADGPASAARGPRWEFTPAGRGGRPSGTSPARETTGPRTRLGIRHDLGITVSEAVQGSA